MSLTAFILDKLGEDKVKKNFSGNIILSRVFKEVPNYDFYTTTGYITVDTVSTVSTTWTFTGDTNPNYIYTGTASGTLSGSIDVEGSVFTTTDNKTTPDNSLNTTLTKK